jgi:predicted esterase
MTSHYDRVARRFHAVPLRFFLPALLSVLGTACSSSDASPASNTGHLGADSGGPMGPEPKLPAAPTDCPVLATGNISVMNQQVQLWVGQKQPDKKAPILFYWHGTGSNSGEASLFMASQIQEIQDEGGLVASFTTSTATAMNTGNNVWYTGDFDMVDYILGCAIQQLNIDTHQIYTAGCSAGGLQAGAMVYARSSYLAAAMTNSGGSLLSALEDPSHVPSVISAHGSCADKVILFFANMSKAMDKNISQQGGIAVDCDHGGGHCGDPAPLVAAQWQFLKDHPFGVSPDPYANGFPASVPAFAQYCRQYPDPNPPPDCM